MFDDVLRQLKRLEAGISISVELQLDDEGYLDRKCPGGACGVEFKVLNEDWVEKVSDEQVVCPVCGQVAPATEWNTDEQGEYLEAVGLAEVSKIVNGAMGRDVARFNRSQRPSFVNISMSVGPTPSSFVMPVAAAEAMRRKWTCEMCGCRYAAIGSAFFCPACGHNSVVSAFQQTVDAARHAMTQAATIRAVLSQTFDPDFAHDSVRQLIEGSLGQLVGAFQQYAEAMFEKLPGAGSIKRRKNVFQNLTESSALWRSATGKGYEDVVATRDLAELAVLFQKRHLLLHCNAIVDQEYVDKSGDTTYVLGQRLVVQEAAVLRLADLISQLGQGLSELLLLHVR